MPEKRRMLSPEIRKDPELLKLSRDIRLFFSYLLMSADDAGNFDGDELKVKMETFPGDDDVTVEIVKNWLQELVKGNRKRGFVIPYCGDRDDGDRIYYHVRQFQKHQPIPHPTAPSYPLFPGQLYTYHRRDKAGKWENCTVSRPICTHKCTRTVHVQYKKCPCSLTPERKLKEVKGKEKDLKDLRQPVDNSGSRPITGGANDGGNAEGHPPVAPTPEQLEAQAVLLREREARGIPISGRKSIQ